MGGACAPRDFREVGPPECPAEARGEVSEQQIEVIAVELIEPVAHDVAVARLEDVRLYVQHTAELQDPHGALDGRGGLEVAAQMHESGSADELRVDQGNARETAARGESLPRHRRLEVAGRAQ